jgi:HTH-type transcriptional regulator, global nitrogen regulator NrpRI
MNTTAMKYAEVCSAPPPLRGRSARARWAILKTLNELGESAGALRISEMLNASGIDLQARTVRFHLLKMDRDGLTRSTAKHEGRLITETGKKELAKIGAGFKIGFIASKMDELGYRMQLDTDSATGTIVANTACIHKRDLSRALHFMQPVFASGISLGDCIAVTMGEGNNTGAEIPRGKILLSTISNVTINGIFIKAGIPVVSRFGGLIEIEHGRPKRFVELAEYKGTSMDPHKIFIMANMTKVSNYAQTGTGTIGVSFCEFPSVADEGVQKLLPRIKALHLHCILALGQSNRPLLDIAVGEGRTAMIIADGLNPFAALHEAAIPVTINPLAHLEELSAFVPFKDIAPMGKRSTYVE